MFTRLHERNITFGCIIKIYPSGLAEDNAINQMLMGEMITSLGMTYDIAFKSSMNDYLTKPVRRITLANAIQTILRATN
jgi:CheY-like chemotaxis protein